MPLAMRRADLAGAELVVISHHAFANRVRPPAGVPTLSYVHSPARWMWDEELRELELGPGPAKSALALFSRSQKGPDRRAAARMNRLVANSATVAARIEQWWGLDAEVVHPPVDVDFFSPDPSIEREDFFLLAGRLVPYKRPEIAVAAAAAAGVRLVVAGSGRSLDACRAIASPTTEFLNDVDDTQLRDLFRRCRALVFPGVEDFGIVPVEAQACATPVLGIDAGGLRETIIDGVTGRLVPFDAEPGRQAAMVADALRSFPEDGFDARTIRLHAERFGPEVFRKSIESIVTELLS
jgi:glycosyltransferase involved in cell wall biosynthesis